MAQRRTNKRTGEVQEMRGGQWVTVVPPKTAPQGITIAPGNPYAAAEAEARARAAQGDAAAIPDEATLRQLAIDKQRLENEAAQIEIERKREERESKVKSDEDAIRRANIMSVAEQIRVLEGLHRDYLKGGFPNQIAGRMPTDWNADFDTAGSQLLEVGQAAFRIPGTGDQNAQEMQFKLDAYLPRSTDTDKEIERKLSFLRGRVDENAKALGMEPIDWKARVTPPQPTATQQRVVTPDQQGQVGLSQGGTRSVEDPTMKAVAGRLGKMVADNVPDREIYDFLQRSRVNPADFNIGQILQYRATNPEFKAWKQQNPGKAYPINPSFYNTEVPLTGTEGAFNAAAQSPVGAYAISAANAVTAGNLDSAVGASGGNTDLARLGMDAVRSQNPWSSFAGDVTGAAMDQALLSRLPFLRGGSAGKWAANDAIYGSAAGAGEADGNRLVGATFGGALSPVPGMLASRGARVVRGTDSEPIRYLNDAGVDMTVGQIARGSDSLLGNMVAKAEDIGSGYPIVGDVINAGRRRSLESANEAAFRQGGSTSNEIGVPGLAHMKGDVNTAYGTALGGVNVKQDPLYQTDFTRALARGTSNPRHGADFQHIVDTEIAPLFGPNGELTGENLQAAIQTLRRHSSNYDGKELGGNMKDSLKEMENALTGMVSRQSPATMPALNDANRLHTNRSVLRDAVHRGRNTDEVFTMAQLNDASTANTKRFGGADKAVSAERPFYDLSTHGQSVLPSKMPDSGTAGRAAFMAIPTILGGGAGALTSDQGALDGGQDGSLTGLAVAGLLAAPYSRVGQRAVQRVLVPSAARVRGTTKIDEILGTLPPVRRAPGMLGSAGIRDYMWQEEYPPR